MKNAEFIVISAPKNMDYFMKAADLFHHKNLGIIENVTVEYEVNTKLTLKKAEPIILLLKEALESAGRIVSLVHLKQVGNGNTIYINDSIKPYVDLKARQVSDGRKSFIMAEFIEATTPFKCETDENYFIKKLI